MNLKQTDVAIIGAGPYGLSLAAQLRARGVGFRIFGQPMKFWRDMPRTLNLKSFAFATSLYVPEPGFTFPEWSRQRGLEDLEPCTMESFAAYGLWMKDHFVPDLEPVDVKNVSARGDGFDVTLSTGEQLNARRVVMAVGLSYFAHVPLALQGIPNALVSHTFFHTDYSPFAGKEVAVLGGGASAIEAGALLHEAGAHAQILVRSPSVVFHSQMPRNRALVDRLRKPNTVIGPGGKNWIMERVPFAVRLLPEEWRLRFATRYLGPAAPWWIKDRVEGKVPIHVQTELVGTQRVGNRLRLHLREGGTRERSMDVDHVMAGTGYDFDVDRVTILDAALRDAIRRTARAPALSLNFETSVRGMYFIGPASSLSFGPLYRFVCGAQYAAPALARHMAGPVREVIRHAERLRGAVSPVSRVWPAASAVPHATPSRQPGPAE